MPIIPLEDIDLQTYGVRTFDNKLVGTIYKDQVFRCIRTKSKGFLQTYGCIAFDESYLLPLQKSLRGIEVYEPEGSNYWVVIAEDFWNLSERFKLAGRDQIGLKYEYWRTVPVGGYAGFEEEHEFIKEIQNGGVPEAAIVDTSPLLDKPVGEVVMSAGNSIEGLDGSSTSLPVHGDSLDVSCTSKDDTNIQVKHIKTSLDTRIKEHNQQALELDEKLKQLKQAEAMLRGNKLDIAADTIKEQFTDTLNAAERQVLLCLIQSVYNQEEQN